MIQIVRVMATASSLTAIETAIHVELVTSGDVCGSLINASAWSNGKPARTASTAAVAATPTPVTNTAINATNQNNTACSRVGISLAGACESGVKVAELLIGDAQSTPGPDPRALPKTSALDARTCIVLPMMGQTGKGLKFSFVLLCLLGVGGCSSTEDL